MGFYKTVHFGLIPNCPIDSVEVKKRVWDGAKIISRLEKTG
jgi:hypothetical protein